MTIKNLTVNSDFSVTLVTETGDILSMSSALAGCMYEQYAKHSVRNAIRYACEDMDGDEISLGSLDMTEEEFREEVFSMLEEEIECGNYPSEETIKEYILDTAESYGICIDE